MIFLTRLEITRDDRYDDFKVSEANSIRCYLNFGLLVLDIKKCCFYTWVSFQPYEVPACRLDRVSNPEVYQSELLPVTSNLTLAPHGVDS